LLQCSFLFAAVQFPVWQLTTQGSPDLCHEGFANPTLHPTDASGRVGHTIYILRVLLLMIVACVPKPSG
jgi:hypothetical protein